MRKARKIVVLLLASEQTGNDKEIQGRIQGNE